MHKILLNKKLNELQSTVGTMTMFISIR